MIKMVKFQREREELGRERERERGRERERVREGESKRERERICVFKGPLGLRAVWTRFGARSPQPHWGSSIHLWQDYRRKVRAIAEKLNVAADMELTNGE